MNQYAAAIAGKLNLRTIHVEAVLQLFDEGGTVPFIARYRKDKTGAMDEVAIQQVQDEVKRMTEFDERKAAIVKSITEQGKMTEAIMEKLDKAATLSELEDIYLPFKPKRKTKASVAREHGLEPLALLLLEQQPGTDPVQEAQGFINEHVKTTDEALQGARDILAEKFSEDADIRAAVRRLFEDKADLVSRLIPEKETEAAKFRDYFEYSEPIHKIPSHRILAVLRGFLEGFLRISIEPAEQDALDLLERKILTASNDASVHVKKAIRDSYKRLLQPGLETEMRTTLKQRGDEEAINVFAENLRQLLLSSPLGGKRLLALDPGYRTGCKTVCLDEKGDLQTTDVIYIHEPGKLYSAEHTIRHLVEKHGPQAIAIGDGTAGRETEQFIKGLALGLPVFLVNEDGASIYSASEIARDEFPDQDITVRGAVSIGRRLMDPLAELVKIDPKSIGVGQYQHDVNQFRLKERLDQTVVSCVNQVGVNLNTASKHLLAYVSGINSGIADQIVKYRKEVGRFNDRKQLMKVPRLGEKAFEQCAGFLRIKDGVHPLDGSAVHPEAYGVVERMATDLGVELSSLIGNEELVRKIDPKKYADERFGLLTLNDILNELKKPGLDPRAEIQHFEFARIYSLDDVQTDMVVPGIVTNLTRFGAFVDIGVKQDGLVHISEIAHQYISDPSQALKLSQPVMVKVLEVDRVRKRIALSIRQATEAPAGGGREKPRGQRPVQGAAPKEKDLSNMNMEDALSALKKKFGR
jgi:protein Tex